MFQRHILSDGECAIAVDLHGEGGLAGTRTIDVAAGEGVTGGTQGDGVVTLGGLQSGGARAAQFQAVDLRFAGGGIIGTIQQGGRADHGGCAGGADWAVGKRFTGGGFIEADTARGRFEAHLWTIIIHGDSEISTDRVVVRIFDSVVEGKGLVVFVVA